MPNGKVFIAHGTEDTVVPYVQSAKIRTYYESFGMSSNNVSNYRVTWHILVKSLPRYMPKRSLKRSRFAILIIDFAIADRIANFWLNADRRSRSNRGKKFGDCKIS